MNKLIIKSLCSVLLLLSFTTFAQLSKKEQLTDVLYLMDEHRYAAALPTLYELYEEDKNNANINYSIGLCILNSNIEKDKEGALPYLRVASENVSTGYIYLNGKEKRAPVETWFYLGQAQHNDYQFDEAIESFKKFQTYINDKHFLYKDAQQGISMAEYAKQAVLNPVNVVATNLGNKLNGFYSDFSPVVRIDESAIYFTSRRLRKDSSNYEIHDPIDGKLFEDLYVSFKEEDGTWSEASPLNINTEGHEATINLSVDGQTLYIYKDLNGHGGLFESHLLDDSAGVEVWSEPKKLGSDINSKAHETHVTITPDGRTLYFTSDREGGYGEKDIYFCKLLPNGKWALAQNAGPILNSIHNEDGVFMHPDGKTMYFSSDGHQSMGGYDIVYSTLTDTGWTKPTNMGYPINSVHDDVFFVTTPDGKRAYFSSFKEEGYGEKDIYLLNLVDADEISLTLYRGEFTFENSRTPPSGAEVTITNNYTGELEGVYSPRKRDGQFTAILAPNNSYHFLYEADEYDSYEEDIYVSDAGNYQEIYKDIKLKPVRVGDRLTAITPAPMRVAGIRGGLTKRGVPLKGMKILLMEEDENLISQTTSDDTGDFKFEKLDPSQTYLLRVISPTGNPLSKYNIDVVNDEGEDLAFEPLDDTTYIFVPSLDPYQFYGIRAKAIAGKVKKEGLPVPKLNVRLEDEQEVTLQETVTDQYGEFNFQKLSLDREYKIIFEGDFPEDPEILITNDIGREMRFRKVARGEYVYVPQIAALPKAKFSDISGSVVANGEPISNLKVLLLDSDTKLLSSANTDDVGKFNFMALDLTRRYFIKFEGDFPEDLKLVVANDELALMLFKKIEEGFYQYDPVFVRLENANNEVLGKQITENVGEFNYSKLEPDQYYRLVYEGDFPNDEDIVILNGIGEEFIFKKAAKKGIFEYIPREEYYTLKQQDGTILANRVVRIEDSRRKTIRRATTDKDGNFKFRKLPLDEVLWLVIDGEEVEDNLLIVGEDGQKLTFYREPGNDYKYTPTIATLSKKGLKSYTVDVNGSLDFKETYPRPEELKDVVAYFQKYFSYNEKDINEGNKEFVAFIKDIAALVKTRREVKLIITSSASKVPTRTWKTNTVLTKKRAYDTKVLLEKIFKREGILPSQYNFVDINTLITGPEYKGDYAKNKSTYEKYQYVRIFVK